MTVEGVEERPDGPVLLFRRPAGDHRKLMWGMRALMVLAVFSSLRNTWDLMTMLGNILEVTEELKRVLFEDPDPELALVRDYSLFLQSVASFVLLLTVVVFVALIVRYAVLWFQVPKGHPKTYRQLRFWAALLIAVEFLVALMWGFVTLEQYEELQVGRAFSPLALVGVVMLILLALRPYKRFFSQYRIERAPEPVPEAAPAAQPTSSPGAWIPAPGGSATQQETTSSEEGAWQGPSQ